MIRENESDEPVADEPDFPSGEWVGFYQEAGSNRRQDLRLEFREGSIRGDGIDTVGHFTIRGGYDSEKREAWWTKQYLGGHSVSYRGFREIKGIWGTWEIPPVSRDGFHIWPRAQGMGEHLELRQEVDVPASLTC